MPGWNKQFIDHLKGSDVVLSQEILEKNIELVGEKGLYKIE